jgi:hypothetical protein
MRNPYAMKLCAEYAVASELAIRGYSVFLTKGAHPGDMIVTSPKGKTFMIDVKGTRPKPDGSQAHWWPLTPKTYRIGKTPLFYVFVYRDNEGGMTFRVMRKSTAERRVLGLNPPCIYGLQKYIDNWNILPK